MADDVEAATPVQRTHWLREWTDETSAFDPEGVWNGGCDCYERKYSMWIPNRIKPDDQDAIDAYVDKQWEMSSAVASGMVEVISLEDHQAALAASNEELEGYKKANKTQGLDIDVKHERIVSLQHQLTAANEERDNAYAQARAIGKIENERAIETMRLQQQLAAANEQIGQLKRAQENWSHGMDIVIQDYEQQLATARAEAVALREALEFYADPETYHACTFLFDSPTGGFDEDLDEDHGHGRYDRPMPGKLARQALAAVPPQPTGRTACESCWTISWVPIEREELAFGVNHIKDKDGNLFRCDYCWLSKLYRDNVPGTKPPTPGGEHE